MILGGIELNNDLLVCSQVDTPDDIFSDIVNSHHDKVRAHNQRFLEAERKRKRRLGAIALTITGVVLLLTTGFLTGKSFGIW